MANGAIRFGGRWELRPKDERNWELYQLRSSSRGFGDGVERWAPLGRFYQSNTVHLALQYAADCALKDKAYGEQMELQDALHEYRAIVDVMVADVRAAMGGAA